MTFTGKYVSREAAVAHLNESANLLLFRANQGRSVEEYFADYAAEYERDNNGQPDALYQCVCADLGIRPRNPDRERADRKLS